MTTNKIQTALCAINTLGDSSSLPDEQRNELEMAIRAALIAQNVEGVHFHSYGDGFIRLTTDNGYLFDVTIPKKERPPIDVEALKREADENGARTVYFSDRGWNACIDHLASKYDFVPKGSCLRAPLPRIEGLDDELEIYNIPDDQTFEGSAILEAARAYLKASEV